MEGDKLLSPPAAEFKVPGLVGPTGQRKPIRLKNAEIDDEAVHSKSMDQEDRHEPKPDVGETDDKHKHISFTPSKVDTEQRPDGMSSASESEPTDCTDDKLSRKRKHLDGAGKQSALKLNYNVPAGSMPFDTRYSLEVLKTGSILDRIVFSKDKTFIVVGRIPACDVIAENPTVSRIHAIVQYCGGGDASNNAESKMQTETSESADKQTIDESKCSEKGLYLYDLNSTHGTFLNKNQIYPRRYYRLRVGHMIKFGNSTRLYIVAGPSDDVEEESEKTVTELLKERLEKEFIRKKIIQASKEAEKEKIEDEGINWGMGDDAEEETDLSVNPFSTDFESGDLNLDNPKKTLAGWFEREGFDNLFYDVREKVSGQFICRINLPLDGPGGTSVFAEVDAKGKKKDIMVQCALQACQILDKYGVLRQSHHEGYKRKLKGWEEKDYYSSDEDTFLDRTGSIETKRKRRMKQSGKDEEKAESFDSLSEKFTSFQDEIERLELKIHNAEIKQEKDNEDDEADPLEAFMQTVKCGGLEIKHMKTKLKEIREQQARVKKLMDIARPSNIPLSLSAKIEPFQSSSMKKLKTENLALGPKSDSPQLDSEDIKPSNSSLQRQTHPAFESVDSTCVSTNVVAKKIRIIGPQVPPPSKESSKVEHSTENEDNINQRCESIVVPDIGSASPTKSQTLEESPTKTEEDNKVLLIEEDSSSKKKRKRNRTHIRKEENEYDINNPDYSDWVPPVNQAGDGRTSLNDRLGY